MFEHYPFSFWHLFATWIFTREATFSQAEAETKSKEKLKSIMPFSGAEPPQL
jgi:hypothetical protein